jgi:hypothetical protein
MRQGASGPGASPRRDQPAALTPSAERQTSLHGRRLPRNSRQPASRGILWALLATVAGREAAAVSDRGRAGRSRDARHANASSPTSPTFPSTRSPSNTSATGSPAWSTINRPGRSQPRPSTTPGPRFPASSATPADRACCHATPANSSRPCRSSAASLTTSDSPNRPLPRRLRAALPTARRTAHRHRRTHLRSARPDLD